MNKIRLSEAQISALECRVGGLDPTTIAAWDGEGLLQFSDSDREGLWNELNEASNSEDAHAAIHGCKLAGRAARSLSVVAGKVILASTRPTKGR